LSVADADASALSCARYLYFAAATADQNLSPSLVAAHHTVPSLSVAVAHANALSCARYLYFAAATAEQKLSPSLAAAHQFRVVVVVRRRR
jgi:hypothetical protein